MIQHNENSYSIASNASLIVKSSIVNSSKQETSSTKSISVKKTIKKARKSKDDTMDNIKTITKKQKGLYEINPNVSCFQECEVESDMDESISDFCLPEQNKYKVQLQNKLGYLSQFKNPIKNVDQSLRIQLLNWVQQIFNTYQLQIDTYFRTLQIFDQYLMYLQETDSNTVHLLMIVSLFISIKFHEVKQFSLDFMVSKVGFDKFNKEEIKQMEMNIISKLGFELFGQSSLVDLAINMIKMSEQYLSEQKMSILQNIIEIVLVSVSYNQKILQKVKIEVVAGICCYISLKKLQTIDSNFEIQQIMKNILDVLQMDHEKFIEVSQQVLEFLNMFNQLHSQPMFSNFKEFHDKKSTQIDMQIQSN